MGDTKVAGSCVEHDMINERPIYRVNEMWANFGQLMEWKYSIRTSQYDLKTGNHAWHCLFFIITYAEIIYIRIFDDQNTFTTANPLAKKHISTHLYPLAMRVIHFPQLQESMYIYAKIKLDEQHKPFTQSLD